jgi:hypothetical protein
MKLSLRLSVALLVPTLASAFSVHTVGSRSTAMILNRPFVNRSARFMASDEKADSSSQSTPIIKSGRKEIAYDESTGRFFETGLDETECIPDEEFCITDKGTGKLIRLTIEEKERIFLDSLQVSS